MSVAPPVTIAEAQSGSSAGGEATPAVALGILSLVVWTLLITTSLKYVAIVMRADNDGEGGIMARPLQ